MSTKRFHSAFTLVELLVVMSIIALLVALLLPAVQMAREAARRAQCASNFKQIGLAVAAYEQTHGMFPAGSYDYDQQGNRIVRGSIFIRLLPYLEQQALYDLFDLSRETLPQTYPGSSRTLAATVLSVYICPSDQPSSPLVYANRGKTNYCPSFGPGALTYSPYLASPCALISTWNQYAATRYSTPAPGCFARNGWNCLLTDITDGVSNTILLGENRPSCDKDIWNGGWAGCETCKTTAPMNYDNCRETATDTCRVWNNYNTEVAFHSLHPGGVQFLFGDGSVHFLPELIDMQNYQYLGNKADGKVAQMAW